MIVEPTVQGILSPHQGVARKIPVVDCLGFEFNDTVLFRPNRLPGYDQVDSGSRVTYGATFIPKAAFLRTTRLFLGQTYSFGKPPGDLYGAGLMAKASDVVGNLQTNPHPWVSFDYRFRLSRKNLSPAFSEIFSALGPKIFRLGTSYIRASPNLTDRSIQKDQVPLKQISFNLSSEFESNWKTELFHTRNLNKHQTLTQGMRLVFQNECLTASFSVGRSYYRSATIRPSTTILFTVALKNLGGGNLKSTSSQAIPGSLKPLSQSPVLGGP
jgi:LPS-assembly protein